MTPQKPIPQQRNQSAEERSDEHALSAISDISRELRKTKALLKEATGSLQDIEMSPRILSEDNRVYAMQNIAQMALKKLGAPCAPFQANQEIIERTEKAEREIDMLQKVPSERPPRAHIREEQFKVKVNRKEYPAERLRVYVKPRPGTVEYLSLQEHESLLLFAQAEARRDAFEELLRDAVMYRGGLDECLRKKMLKATLPASPSAKGGE